MSDVTLPMSKSGLKQLGKRLASGDLRPGDEELLQDTLLVFDAVRQAVFELLVDGRLDHQTHLIAVTSRTKTRSTLIDKLRMHPEIALTNINDLAGIRVVTSGGLEHQDELISQILHSDVVQEPRTIDRRLDPRQGYRAVHVTGKARSLPVEIQIRTELQHNWANLFERLGDLWGRQYRYEPAETAGPDIASAVRVHRAQIVKDVQDFSTGTLAQVEELGRLADRAIAEYQKILDLEGAGSRSDRRSTARITSRRKRADLEQQIAELRRSYDIRKHAAIEVLQEMTVEFALRPDEQRQ